MCSVRMPSTGNNIASEMLQAMTTLTSSSCYRGRARCAVTSYTIKEGGQSKFIEHINQSIGLCHRTAALLKFVQTHE